MPPSGGHHRSPGLETDVQPSRGIPHQGPEESPAAEGAMEGREGPSSSATTSGVDGPPNTDGGPSLKPNQPVIYPPATPLCLRAYTRGSDSGSRAPPPRPSRARMAPQPGAPTAQTTRPLPDALLSRRRELANLSQMEREEDRERVARARCHAQALSKDHLAFHRKREPGGLLDYSEETHHVRNFLDKIHAIRDESILCPPKSGFSYRRVEDTWHIPVPYDTCLDAVRPRTVGFSPGHIRSFAPTPPLTWAGRRSRPVTELSSSWTPGTDTAEAAEAPAQAAGKARPSTFPSRRAPAHGGGGGGREGDGASVHGGDGQWLLGCVQRDNNTATDGQSLIRPMWSRQSCRSRPFTSSWDHLGRPMSRLTLSRSLERLKQHQFDTLQRRQEYSEALACKTRDRKVRAAASASALQEALERGESAREQREGIAAFQDSLAEVLAQKREYL